MATSNLPPGAWLSGFVPFASTGPALNPPVQPGASHNPPVQPGSSHNPPVQPGSSHNPPVQPGSSHNPPVYQPGPYAGQWVITRAGPMPAEPPVPWSGIDPDWVWSGSDSTLLAQALRKVRDRIVPPVDPRQPPATRAVPMGRSTTPALWRWDEPFRISAVVAELLGRIVVEGLELWWVPSPAERTSRGSVSPRRLLTLTPPAANFDYSDQIDKVLRAAVEREDRMPEILTQAGDIGIFFDAITGIDRATAPRLRELLQVAWEVSTHLVMALKNNVGEWRPYQRSARVMPVIVTPGHGSLPSGHATMAVLTSQLLSALLYTEPTDPRRSALDRLARRIAFNRVVAGVHFPMDSAAGEALAYQLALVFAACGNRRGRVPPEDSFDVMEDSELRELQRSPLVDPAPPPPHVPTPAARQRTPPIPMPATAPLWRQMWEAAQSEVGQRRV